MDISFNDTPMLWSSILDTNWTENPSNTLSFFYSDNEIISNDNEYQETLNYHYQPIHNNHPTLQNNYEPMEHNYHDSQDQQDQEYVENQENLTNNINSMTNTLLNRPSRNNHRDNMSSFFQRRTRRRRILPLDDFVLNVPSNNYINSNQSHNEDFNNDDQANIVLNNNLSPYTIINNETQSLNNYDPETAIIRTVLENSFSNDKNKYKSVLDDPSGNIIKIIPFNSSININSSCPIFQTDFSDNDNVAILPCKHCFTIEAITKWLSEQKAECPVCREQFTSKEIPQDNETLQEDLDNLPIISIPNFRNNDLANTLSHMIDILYERNEERQLQQVLINSIYSDS